MADIRVVQRRSGPSFLLESIWGSSGGVVSGQHLQRDRATELDITGLINRAHPAGADQDDEFVRPSRSPGERGIGADYDRLEFEIELWPLRDVHSAMELASTPFRRRV